MTYYRLIPVDEKKQIQTVETELQKFGDTAIVVDPEFGESIVLSREEDWTEEEIRGIVQTKSVVGAFPPDMFSELLHALNIGPEDLAKLPGFYVPGISEKGPMDFIKSKDTLTGSVYEKRMLSSLRQYLSGKMTIRKHYQETDIEKLITLFLNEESQKTASSRYDSSTLFDMLVGAKILIRYQLDHNTTCYRVKEERL
jgi:hypothetical protein